MNRCIRSFSVLILLALCTLNLGTMRIQAAGEPGSGEELLTTSGSIGPGQVLPVTFYSGGPANVRLAISGGAAGDTVQATIQGGSPASWTARTGETIWGYATLPAANGSLQLKNLGQSTLNFALVVYALDTAPSFGEGMTTLQGTAQSAGINSAVQINAAQSGMYRFALSASDGSYQLRVDDGAIIKTAVAGATPAPDDTAYYLDAGVHTLVISQSTAAATTNWSLALTPIGGSDILPTSEQAPQLGGGSFFSEERIPLHLAAAQAANIRIAATGGATDSLTIELYNGTTKVYTSSPVFGGEVAWGNAALAAGANAVRVVTKAGNAAALAYSIQVDAVAATPFSWQGSSYGAVQHTSDGRSQIQLSFPKDGLYSFTLAASEGRYQLTLNDNYMRKTVTTAGTVFTAFVPAGSQTLTVEQDPAAAQTVWNIEVAATDQPADDLPFSANSGTLGGTGNAFREEWIPIHVAAGAPINLRVTVTGNASDAMQVEIFNGDSTALSAANVFGGEVYWASGALTAGKNLVHITVPQTNTGQISYELLLDDVPTMPNAWAGVSRGVGMRSTLTLNAPVSATYLVTVTVTNGAGQINIDGASAAVRASRAETGGTQTVLRVPLTAGPHSFSFQQDATIESTSWTVATNLRRGVPTPTTTVFLPMTQN